MPIYSLRQRAPTSFWLWLNDKLVLTAHWGLVVSIYFGLSKWSLLWHMTTTRITLPQPIIMEHPTCTPFTLPRYPVRKTLLNSLALLSYARDLIVIMISTGQCSNKSLASFGRSDAKTEYCCSACKNLMVGSCTRRNTTPDACFYVPEKVIASMQKVSIITR